MGAVGRPGYRYGNVTVTNRAFYYGGRRYYGVRAGRFIYPAGWHYRRWAVGATLAAVFLTSTYYFTSYAAMGLPAPAYGQQWVRYGPDLLLVEIPGGRVIQVIHGAVEE